jgi:hypothetical protein
MTTISYNEPENKLCESCIFKTERSTVEKGNHEQIDTAKLRW